MTGRGLLFFILKKGNFPARELPPGPAGSGTNTYCCILEGNQCNVAAVCSLGHDPASSNRTECLFKSHHPGKSTSIHPSAAGDARRQGRVFNPAAGVERLLFLR